MIDRWIKYAVSNLDAFHVGQCSLGLSALRAGLSNLTVRESGLPDLES